MDGLLASTRGEEDTKTTGDGKKGRQEGKKKMGKKGSRREKMKEWLIS